MYTNHVQLVGNLVDAPDVQVTQSGVVRARFRLASTERRRDPVNETWQDGESVFLDVTCWRRLAQNVGNSLVKGDRVVVLGRMRQWVAERDGVRRTMHEVEAEVVGADLQRGMVTIARPRRVEATEGDSADVSIPGADVDVETGEIRLGDGEAARGEGAGGGGLEMPEGGSALEGEFSDGAALDAVFDARPLADSAV